MWEYNYTNPDDFIQHSKSHKYLYKKVVNGKMRYYYDVGKGGFKAGGNDVGKDGQPTDSEVRGYTKFEDLIGKDERDARDRAKDQYERAKSQYERDSALKGSVIKRNNISIPDEYSKKADAELEAFYKDLEYSKTPLGKLEAAQDKIQKGKNAVADYLEKMAKNLRH